MGFFDPISITELRAEQQKLEAMITPTDRANAANFEAKLGLNVPSIRRPDGTEVASAASGALSNIVSAGTGVINNVTQGIAKVTTGSSPAQAIMNIASGSVGDLIEDGLDLLASFSTIKRPGGPPYENVLEQFASYTPLWTLACLTPDQFNDPNTYRGLPGALENVIFSSAGRYSDQRTQTFPTGAGAPEYFVNNFQLDLQTAASKSTGNSNLIKGTFDVYEPYSMGFFLQSVQGAALNAGYPNHSGTPYLLKLEFFGHKDDGSMYESSEDLEKYFVINLNKVTFSTNEGGSTYKVEFTPANHTGFTNLVNQIKTDVTLEGESVVEILTSGVKSLCVTLNKEEADTVPQKQDYADEYLIVFPTTWDDKVGIEPGSYQPWGDVTFFDPTEPISAPLVGRKGQDSTEYGEGPVGQATLDFGPTTGGNYTFGLEGVFTDENTGLIKRGEMKIVPKQRSFNFPKGRSIQNIISSVVLSTKYANDALDPKNLDNEGRISWFRVDVQMKLGELDFKRNIRQRRYIFRVVPFLVHHSVFRNPTAISKGVNELKQIVGKEYNYIYTGLNNDIIKFDIQINNLFQVGKPQRPPEESASVANSDTQQAAETPDKKAISESADDAEATTAPDAAPSMPDPDATKSPTKGGYGATSVEEIVALSLQNAILAQGTTGDLTKINFEIIGDPYWMADHGMGNYIGDSYDGPGSQRTRDGSLNYQGTQTYVNLIFRTPIEPNVNSGLYDFPDESENPYSGLYSVIKVTSRFQDGKFTQTLEATRLAMQPQDVQGKRPSKRLFSVSAEEEDEIKTSHNSENSDWYAVELRSAEEIQASEDLKDFEG
jgi:hypothetical protein